MIEVVLAFCLWFGIVGVYLFQRWRDPDSKDVLVLRVQRWIKSLKVKPKE